MKPTDTEIVNPTSDENMRRMHQSDELRRLIVSLPDELLFAVGFHRQMLGLMSQYQQICFLDHARRDEVLCQYMNARLDNDIRTLIDAFGDDVERYYGFQVTRDYSWDRNFDRPRDPWVFESTAVELGGKKVNRTDIKHREIFVTLDERSKNGPGEAPILQLEYLDRRLQREESNGWAIEVEAEECVTPLKDFCCPPDATVKIGFRKDGRIDVEVWAKEMPGSPVLHWIFPDPKGENLPNAYRDFLWWL